MKIKLNFLFLMMIVVFTACSDEEAGLETNNDPETNMLVGTWEMTEFTYDGSGTSEYDGLTLTTVFTGVASDITYTMELADNPQTFTTSGGYNVTLTTTTPDVIIDNEVVSEGITFDQVVALNDVNTSGDWEYDEGMLEGISFNADEASVNGTNQSVDSGTGSSEVTELTETSLKISFTGSKVQLQQGIEVLVTTTGDITFEKQ